MGILDKMVSTVAKKVLIDTAVNAAVKTIGAAVYYNSKNERVDSKTIRVPNYSGHYFGMNYRDAQDELVAYGFTNITLLPKKDLIKGWIKKDGAVEEIAINGKTEFKEKSKFPANAHVVIAYHTFKDSVIEKRQFTITNKIEDIHIARCSNCGAQTADDTKLCSKCDSQITGDSPDYSMYQQEFFGKVNKCHNCGEVMRSSESFCNACGYEYHSDRPTVSMGEFTQRSDRMDGLSMNHCSNCGTKMAAKAKFCHKCGAQNTSNSSAYNKRQQEYAGKMFKCPKCGEELKSFWTLCPLCGYELRGTHATSSVKEFDIRFNQTKSIGQKLDLIKTFAVPNTKEDTLEFLIMAVSNITPEVYAYANEHSTVINLSNAWISKYEQVAQKSKIMFSSSSEFTEIQKVYFDKLEKIKISKRAGRKLSKAQEYEAKYKGKDWSDTPKGIVAMVAIPLAMYLLLMLFVQTQVIKSEKKYDAYQRSLETLVEQVQDSIDNRDWQTARIKAEQIVDTSGGSDENKEKWDSIRKSLLNMVEEKQALAEGKITIGVKLSDLKGKHYATVVAQLQEKGFANIRTIAKDDLVLGWINKDGEVQKVTIDGSTEYDKESKYVSSVEIVVSYHSFKD